MSEHFISDDDREYSRLNKKYIKLQVTNKQLLEALDLCLEALDLYESTGGGSPEAHNKWSVARKRAITNAKQMGE